MSLDLSEYLRIIARNFMNNNSDTSSATRVVDTSSVLGSTGTEFSECQEAGRGIADSIMKSRADAENILQNFRMRAPTRLELVKGSSEMKTREVHREAGKHGLRVVTEEEGSPEAKGIVVIHALARMRVYMTVMRELMVKLHGKPLEDYKDFRHSFYEGMQNEIRENDDKEKSRGSIRILTHEDFTLRLEETIASISSKED